MTIPSLVPPVFVSTLFSICLVVYVRHLYMACDDATAESINDWQVLIESHLGFLQVVVRAADRQGFLTGTTWSGPSCCSTNDKYLGRSLNHCQHDRPHNKF